jgi:hypothetical protein
MTAEAFAHTPLSRDNKTGPENSGGASISGPHAPGEGASEFVSRGEPCLDYLASELAKHATSGHELSKGPSDAIAKIIWPDDTEAWIASLAKRDVRTARRWISGEIDAPAHVWAVMFAIATNPNRSVRK